MKIIATLSLVVLINVCLSTAEILKTKPKVPFLRSFEGFKYDTERGPDGVYRFNFHVGDSSRKEERDESGLVKGEYAFVAPEGEEYEFKYEADKEGYRVDSNALPVKPEETDEVKKAKELFFEEYQKALERAQKSGEEGEEDEEESEEESDEESSEEDDDEEESYSIFAAYGFGNNGNKDEAGESSEETSEEDDDEYEAEEEEKEEEKKGGEEKQDSKGKLELKKETKATKKVDTSAYSHFGLRTKPLPYRRA